MNTLITWDTNSIPMQQLKIEHENTIEKKKDRREGKGRVLALSRRMHRLRQNTDTFYVESESSDDHYYFVKFKQDVLESSLWYCSCKDNSTRHIKCKHLFAIEFAIKWGTIKDIDRIPNPTVEDVEIDNTITNQQELLGYPNLPYSKLGQTNNNNKTIHNQKSYLEDDYDF
jgi:predicted nucleic acid-binding Zn finger protein